MIRYLNLLLALCFISGGAQARVLDIHHFKTSNGANVYFVPAKSIPMLDIRVVFDAGSARDGQHAGLANLTNELLNQGTANANATQIAEQFENVGAIYSSSTAKDMALLSLRSLTAPQALKPALMTFKQVLQQANFNADAFSRLQKLQLTAIKASQQSPSTVASNAFYKILYGTSAYAQPTLGNAQSVMALTPAEAQHFYKQFYVAHNATVILVGAIDQRQAQDIANTLMQGLPPGVAAKALAMPKALANAKTQRISFPSSQTNIRIGQLGITQHSSDKIALRIGNFILGGGGFVSRLMQEVRDKRGLSYAVYSYFQPMNAQGPFIIALGTRSTKAEQALKVTRDTLNRLVQTGPNKAEMTAAKKNMVGSFPLRFDSNKSIANALLVLGFYHLPLDYFDTYIARVQQTTQLQVKTAMATTLHPQKMLTVIVGKTA